jgi:hypothetical protein
MDIPHTPYDHPLVKSIPNTQIEHIQYLYKAAALLPQNPIPLLSGEPHPFLTQMSFQHLLQYGHMTDDTILHALLTSFRNSFPSIHFLDTNFHRDLSRWGWKYAFQRYFLHTSSSQYTQRTMAKPTIHASTIMIPIHINDSHWVALTQ